MSAETCALVCIPLPRLFFLCVCGGLVFVFPPPPCVFASFCAFGGFPFHRPALFACQPTACTTKTMAIPSVRSFETRRRCMQPCRAAGRWPSIDSTGRLGTRIHGTSSSRPALAWLERADQRPPLYPTSGAPRSRPFGTDGPRPLVFWPGQRAVRIPSQMPPSLPSPSARPSWDVPPRKHFRLTPSTLPPTHPQDLP